MCLRQECSRYLMIGLLLVLGLSGWAASDTKMVVKKAAVTSAFQPGRCGRRDLAKKDCLFVRGKTRVHVWNNKIFLKTQVGRDLEPLAIQADVVEWNFVRMQEEGGRTLLVLGLWGPPQGEGDVESLMLSVYELTEEKLNQKFNKVIQKRKKMADGQYNYDKILPYKVYVKSGKLFWSVGREEGSWP